MYPNTPQPPAPATPPQDYLNQIAPAQAKKLPFSFGPKVILIVGGILVVLVIIIALAINVFGQGGRSRIEHLAARLDSTTTIVEGAKDTLKSSQLRSLNSNLSLYLANINRDVVEPLQAVGVTLEKVDKKITESESATPITDRLEDARLNAIYDRTYAREMAYRLDTLITLMKEIEASTGNAKLKTFLHTTYPNLEPTQKAFEDFNAANG